MPQHALKLSKLLRLLDHKDGKRASALRADARTLVNKEDGEETGGGDFHLTIWRDMKAHIAGEESAAELRAKVSAHIAVNPRRKNLYPLLSEAFLLWWGEKGRWTNEGVTLAPKSPTALYDVPGYDARIRINNFLALNIGDSKKKYFYPYFSDAPTLTEETARIGLWLLTRALPSIPPQELYILDVLRSKSYCLERNPLKGNEEALLEARYAVIHKEWLAAYQHFKKEAA